MLKPSGGLSSIVFFLTQIPDHHRRRWTGVFDCRFLSKQPHFFFECFGVLLLKEVFSSQRITNKEDDSETKTAAEQGINLATVGKQSVVGKIIQLIGHSIPVRIQPASEHK